MASDFPRLDTSSHEEGRLAKTIEHQTAKLPSDTFLWVAIGAMSVSGVVLRLSRERRRSFCNGQTPRPAHAT
jgi:hypothetical protein